MSFTFPRFALASAGLLAGLIMLGVGGCARSPEFKALANQPVEYQQRHPILLKHASQSVAVSANAHATAINSLQRAEIEGFAQAFRSDGEGTLAIAVPSGSGNETNAVRLSHDIKSILAQAGVPAVALVLRPYRADAAVDSPPILLSYTRLVAAVPHPCGGAGDFDITIYNRQWENFGCAGQANLAAVVANPNDLQRPRPLDKSSAGRRATVLEKYRGGADPKTIYTNPNAGNVSNVGQGN